MSSLAIVDVFVLAENRLLREALLRVFAKKNEIRVVGSNSYTPDIHEQIMATTPAIIVLDSIGLSRSSAQLISTIRSAIPDVKLVMVDWMPMN
jgi:DNA-binding NarL/FixJ family response regulator